jgi:hypothetical protein
VISGKGLADVGSLFKTTEFVVEMKNSGGGGAVGGKTSKALLFQIAPALSYCVLRGRQAHRTSSVYLGGMQQYGYLNKYNHFILGGI